MKNGGFSLGNLEPDRIEKIRIQLLNMYCRFVAMIKAVPLLWLTILMAVTAWNVFEPFLRDEVAFIYSDAGSDTQQVYYPFFVNLANMLEKGEFSFWDLNYGAGCNILTRQADIGSIFTWLICGFGAENVRPMLVVAHVLKILLSGYMCYFYLRNFRFSTFACVTVAYIFAFNGFTILWGQHYFFGNSALLMVFMLWALEKAFASPKGYLWTAVAAFTAMFTSYYLAYMVLLTAAVYALFRLFYIYSFRQLGTIMRKIGGLLAGVLVGGMMAAVLFLPSVSILLSSTQRLDSELTFFEALKQQLTSTYPGAEKWAILSRVYSNNLMGSYDYDGVSGYYGLPTWFFTSLTVFAAAFFGMDLVLRKDKSMKKKMLLLTGCAAALYMAFYPTVPYVMNGFAAVTNRFLFVIMPALALVYAMVLDRIFKKEQPMGKHLTALAGGLAMAVLVVVILKTDTSSNNALALGYVYLLINGVFALISLYAQSGGNCRLKRDICALAALVVIFSNVTMESYVTNNRRNALDDFNSAIMAPVVGGESTINALNYIKENDDGFYRIEKLTTTISGFNDAMVQDYYGISTYNSVINENLIAFSDELCPEMKWQWDGYYTFRDMYTNLDMASLLGIKYVLSYEPIEDVQDYSLYATVGEMLIYRNEKCEGMGKFFANAMDRKSLSNLSMEERQQLLKETLILDGLVEPETTKHTGQVASVRFQYPEREDRYVGTVQAPQDGWLFMAIPYEKGWHAYVDGAEVPILQANIGYCAVAMGEGEHTVTFEYETPLLKQGFAITCVGFVIFSAWCVVAYWPRRKEKENDSL